jgi:hypothetical protein
VQRYKKFPKPPKKNGNIFQNIFAARHEVTLCLQRTFFAKKYTKGTVPFVYKIVDPITKSTQKALGSAASLCEEPSLLCTME